MAHHQEAEKPCKRNEISPNKDELKAVLDYRESGALLEALFII